MKSKYYIEKIDTNQRRINLNKSWKFALGDIPGFYENFFDDSSWDYIDLPHDYSIDRPYSRAGEAQSAYKLGGVGLYRKSFTIGKKKRANLSFDGIYCDVEVFLNGKKLACHHHGYSPFLIDITDFLYHDRENILAIKVDNPIPTSRWYSGSGIYRDVDLILTDDIAFDEVRIDDYGLEDKKGEIDLEIRSFISNKSNFDEEITLEHKLIYEDKLVERFESEVFSIEAKGEIEVKDRFPISYPSLWSVDDPKLYKIESLIKHEGKIIDKITGDYGFRYFAASSTRGFSLNGKHIKLKAVCLHHDQGALGAADYYRAILRQVRLMKDMGANAIRITHNPGSKKLIDIANKEGLFLIEEIFDGWILDKNNNYKDYSRYFDQKIGESELINATCDMTWGEFDLKETLRRDYNAPSIIAYSLGNELLCGTNQTRSMEYPSIARDLISWARELDKKRFLTIGDNSLRDGYHKDLVEIEGKLTEACGLVGLNYCDGGKYDKIHKDHPKWILWQSESASSINSRACYDRLGDGLREDMRLTSYDESKVAWGNLAAEAWFYVINRDFVMGEAVWTGFDYLGEPTPYNGIERGAPYGFPAPRSSFFGIVDTAGFPKDSYYLYKALWNEKDKTTHILPSWNDKELGDLAENVPIIVYTNASAVELIFTDEDGNIKSLGKKYMEEVRTKAGFTYKKVKGEEGPKSLYMTWHMPYEKGEISATSFDKNGKIIRKTLGRSKIKTPTDDTFIKLEAFYPSMGENREGINFITIDLVDEDGNIKTNASDEISVEVSDNAQLLGLDSGLQTDFDPFKTDKKRAYAGRLLAIVKAKGLGPLKLKASGQNLRQAELTIPVWGKFHKRNSLVYDKYLINSTPEDLILEENKKITWKLIEKDNYHRTYVGDWKSGLINLYVLDIKGEPRLMDYEMAIFEDETPLFPKSLPLVDEDGQIYYHGKDISYDDFDEEKFRRDGFVRTRARLKLLGKNYESLVTVRKLVERYRKDAYIEDFALEKRVSEDEICFAYDTQQIFGEIEIYPQASSPKLRFFIGESENEDRYKEIRAYKKTRDSSKTTFIFERFPATFIKIVGDVRNVSKIRLRSMKIKVEE